MDYYRYDCDCYKYTSFIYLASSITNTFTKMDGVEDVIYNDVDNFAMLGTAVYASNAVLPSPSSGS